MTLIFGIIAVFFERIASYVGAHILLNKVFHWRQRRWFLIAVAVGGLFESSIFLLSTHISNDFLIDMLSLGDDLALLIASFIATEGKWYKKIFVTLSVVPISNLLIGDTIASFTQTGAREITNLTSLLAFIGLTLLGFLLLFFTSLPSRNIKSRRTGVLTIVVFSFLYEFFDAILDPMFIEVWEAMGARHAAQLKNVTDLIIFLGESSFLRFVFLVILPVTILFGINFFMSQRYYREEAQVNADYLEAQAKYYENIKKSNSEIRKLRHDYRNHLTVLSLLIGNGDTEKALDYINDMNGNLLSPISICNTGNETSDAIISDKISKATELGINLIVEGKFSYPDMKPIDICTILGNVLDNAIEAVTRENKKHTLQNKDIHLAFIVTNNFFMINETNKTVTPLKYDGSVVVTSKKDSGLHGLGLSNIKTSAEKYNGDVEISCTPSPDVDNEFDYSISIMIPIVEND